MPIAPPSALPNRNNLKRKFSGFHQHRHESIAPKLRNLPRKGKKGKGRVESSQEVPKAHYQINAGGDRTKSRGRLATQ
jgi:hypothetical protein